MEYTLTLNFICENGEKSSISIDGVKSGITKDEVSSLMNTIIDKNIFLTKNGALTKKSGASLTAKTVSKFEVA